MSRARLEKIAGFRRRENEANAKRALSLMKFSRDAVTTAELAGNETRAMVEVAKARRVFNVKTPATFGAPIFKAI